METYKTIHVFENKSKSMATERIMCGSINRRAELDTRQSN